ncbi:MAG: hypothetical protein HY075_04865 [Deltaproteobacteria bacterium]|nr:hypothetical protein [Deltaproteobacteria bacterium]
MAADVGRLLPRNPLVPALALVATLLASPTPAQAVPPFVQACQRLLKIYFRDPAFTEQRAKQYLPDIVKANKKTWLELNARAPEELNGLSLAEALKLLEQLKAREDAAAGGQHVRNATYFVRLGEGHKAVVKRRHTRSEMGEGRVYNFSNDPRFEVLAFVLDRFLGTNLVPPAILLDATTAAQLLVRAGPVKQGKLSKEHATLMELTHMRLLDVLVGNGDRNGPDNLLAADGKVVAIDFDLSRAVPMFPIEAAEFSLKADGVVLEPRLKVGKAGTLPGVFARRVVAQLRALDRAKLVELAEAAGLKLSENEIQSVLAGRAASLAVVERWSGAYGRELVEVSPEGGAT